MHIELVDRNTYSKPHGVNLWYKERDGFWLEFVNSLMCGRIDDECSITAMTDDRVNTPFLWSLSLLEMSA